MESILNETFDRMLNEYELIFNNYYPAHNSTGFMEANQVHLFLKSLTSIKSDAFSWLEAPLKKVNKSYPHIDGVVFIPSTSSVVFIEAKRINNPNQKVEEIYRDIDRLLIDDNRLHIIDKAKFKIEHHYIVYLADVWLETKRKRSIPFWWTSEVTADGMYDFSSVRFNDTDTFLERMHSNKIPWEKGNQRIRMFKQVDKYCLMCGIYKI